MYTRQWLMKKSTCKGGCVKDALNSRIVFGVIKNGMSMKLNIQPRRTPFATQGKYNFSNEILIPSQE
jgi:hypothetical protein